MTDCREQYKTIGFYSIITTYPSNTHLATVYIHIPSKQSTWKHTILFSKTNHGVTKNTIKKNS